MYNGLGAAKTGQTHFFYVLKWVDTFQYVQQRIHRFESQNT